MNQKILFIGMDVNKKSIEIDMSNGELIQAPISKNTNEDKDRGSSLLYNISSCPYYSPHALPDKNFKFEKNIKNVYKLYNRIAPLIYGKSLFKVVDFQ